MDTITQLRSYRVSGLSVFDLTVASIVTEIIVQNTTNLPRFSGVPIAIGVGLVVHFALGINTPLAEKLGVHVEEKEKMP